MYVEHKTPEHLITSIPATRARPPRRLRASTSTLLIGALALSMGCGGEDETNVESEPTGSSGTGGGSDAEGMGGGGSGGESGSGGTSTSGSGGMGGSSEPESSSFSLIFAGPTGAEGVSNLYGLVYASAGEQAGKLYASGVGESGNLVVLRFDADGALDASFGTGGVADTGSPGTAYGVVELASGEVVALGNGGGQAFLVKLSANGTVDADFGRVVVLGWSGADLDAIDTACDAAAASPEDTALADACSALWPTAAAPAFDARPSYTAWDVQLDSVTTPGTEKLVVFGFGAPAKVETGTQRTDNDRWVARVLASDGSPDPEFNSGAPFSIDVGELEGADNGRRGFLDSDGAVVAAGYTNWGDGNQAVLLRLLPDGTPDADFGFDVVADPSTLQPGLTRFNPFVGPGAMAEVYSVIKQSSGRYVTTGYGVSNRDIATLENDLVSFGVGATGLDADWGDGGALAIQSETDQAAIEGGTWEGGRPFRENGRDLLLLEDGRTLHVGCYNDYASLFLVGVDGALDESFGSGGRVVFDEQNDVTHTAPFFAVARSSGGRIAAAAQGDFIAIFEVDGD